MRHAAEQLWSITGESRQHKRVCHEATAFFNLESSCFAPAASCAWRIVISPMIPQDFPSCYYPSMRNLAVLAIHLIATLARLLGPGGVRSLVAESLLLKHQLLIVNRSRQRSPNLSAGDASLPACWRFWCVQPAFSVPQLH